MIRGRLYSSQVFRTLGQRALKCSLCWPGTCLPSFPSCEGDGKTTGSAMILCGEGCNRFCREDFAALIIFSLGVSRSFAKGMGRAADEKV